MEIGILLVLILGIIIGAILTVAYQSLFTKKGVTTIFCLPELTPGDRDALKAQYEAATGGKVVVTSDVKKIETRGIAR